MSPEKTYFCFDVQGLVAGTEVLRKAGEPPATSWPNIQNGCKRSGASGADSAPVAYANLVAGKALTTDNRPVPYAVFTDPQLGRVGLTEREAQAEGRRLKVGKMPLAWVARAIERDETAGLMKLVVDAETDRILGAAILASEGGEVVQILHAVMLAGAPYTLLKGAVYIHPTLAEGLWTLMEAVTAV